MSLMKFFRDNIKIIFIITITGFVVAMFAGVGSYLMTERQNTVAIVNGEKIKKDKFESYLTQQIYQAREELKKDKDNKDANKDIDMTKIKKKTLHDMMQRAVLLQEANKAGEYATDNEIRNVIASYPLFQKNGKFDPATYHKNVRYVVRKSPKKFEQEVKDNVLIEKIKFLIANSVKASDTELKDAYISSGQNPKDYESQRETFRNNYLSNKKFQAVNDWFKAISSNAKVKVLLKD